jgi:hypothetical protein
MDADEERMPGDFGPRSGPSVQIIKILRILLIFISDFRLIGAQETCHLCLVATMQCTWNTRDIPMSSIHSSKNSEADLEI